MIRFGWGFRFSVDGVEIPYGDYDLVQVEFIGDPSCRENIFAARYLPGAQLLAVVGYSEDVWLNIRYKDFVLEDYGVNLSGQWNAIDYTVIDFVKDDSEELRKKKDSGFGVGAVVFGALVALYALFKRR